MVRTAQKRIKRKKKRAKKKGGEPPFELITFDADSMNAFIAEIARHIRREGMITIASATFPPQTWDITRIDKKTGEYTLCGLRFGIEPAQTPLFAARLCNILGTNGYASAVLRSFLEKKDKVTGLPIKELRGYVIWTDDEYKVHFHQLSAEEMKECNTVDARTGRRLEDEPAVIYCGREPDDIILSAGVLEEES